MNIGLIQNLEFDEAVTLAMVESFDRACKSFQHLEPASKVHEIIAKRIVDAAKNGERDPTRLHEQALVPFGIEDMSMVFVSAGRDTPGRQLTRWSRTRRDP